MLKVIVDASDVYPCSNHLKHKVYIEVGSIVTLKGSPDTFMTVVSVSESSLEVCWIDNQVHLQTITLPIKAFYLKSDAIVYMDNQ